MLVNLTYLYLDLVPQPIFGPEFESLTNLEVLGFDYCFLAAMTNDTFKYFTMNIRELHLMRCHDVLGDKVQYGFLQYFKHLKVLNLADTHIHLSRALNLLHSLNNSTMDVINLQRVSDEPLESSMLPFALVLTSEMMKNLRTICVKTLNLADNGIVDFRENSLFSYDHPECFENMVLSGNRFTFHTARKRHELLVLVFKLRNIVLFDLSYNPIHYINEKYLPIPNGNKTFNYKAKECISQDKVKLNSTVYIYLPPKLKVLRFSHFVRESCGRGITVRNASSLEKLDMSYFQFQRFPDLNIEGENNVKWLNMSGIDSSLYLHKNSVPLFSNVEEAFFRFAELGKNETIAKHLFTLIPSVHVLDISYNSLLKLPNDSFVQNIKLRELDLSHNVLHEVPTAILEIKHLRKLNLQNNNLVTISNSITDWLDSLSRKQEIIVLLAGNVLSCSCDNKQFISWLFNTNVKLDPDDQNISNKNYLCRLSNGDIKDTSEIYDHYHELYSDCNAAIWLRFGISLLVTFTVIAFVFAVIFNFRWRIAYYIYRTFQTVIESEMNLNFTYDAYVSYSDDARDWVHHDLAHKIERKWGLKLFIEDRDLLGGQSYVDSIAKSIGSCRQVIFVLTPGLFERQWIMYEIERAKYEKVCKHVQITVSNLGVVVNEVPAEFSSIWNSVCLIDWSEDQHSSDNPWHKLKLRLVLNR
ncbi:toll-like receptor 8 [Mytilus edulis]|uniref:toll-like receptor 8 n=1 Tax=Mytilus edulis TaxID=6550 RepID=UPI0039EED848